LAFGDFTSVKEDSGLKAAIGLSGRYKETLCHLVDVSF